ISLLQVTFLPGYLLLRTLRLQPGVLATAVLSFALSAIANFYLVVLLVAFGIYRPATIYTFFAVEMIVWLRLDFRRLATPIGTVIAAVRQRCDEYFSDLRQSCQFRSGLLRRVLVTAALALIFGFAVASLAETGRIFEQWDAVVSWNRWAIDWAANR